MHRIRISKRSIKWIPSQISAIFARKGDREVEHQVENLPTKERQELLRNLKKQKHKQAGFDWNATAESMKVLVISSVISRTKTILFRARFQEVTLTI